MMKEFLLSNIFEQSKQSKNIICSYYPRNDNRINNMFIEFVKDKDDLFNVVDSNQTRLIVIVNEIQSQKNRRRIYVEKNVFLPHSLVTKTIGTIKVYGESLLRLESRLY